MILHCNFHLHFSNISDDEHLFMCLLTLMSFLEKLVFCPFFNWVVCFSVFELYELFVYFGN